MKAIMKLSAATLLGVLLSACGSGGGGDGSAQNNQATGDLKTGGVFILADREENFTLNKAELENANLTFINVEGKTIQLDRKLNLEDWTIFKEGSGVNETELLICCGKYKNVRFGAYALDVNYFVDGKFYVFYNGLPTTNMPTTGTVNYTGNSMLYAADVDGTIYNDFDEDYLKGTAQLTADFGAKTLTGTLNINEGNVAPIYINSRISGNQFSGKATSESFDTVAQVEGMFYGDKAKELAGVYEDGKDPGFGGAFGASR